METVEANAQQQLEDIVAPGEIFFPTSDLGKNIFYNIVLLFQTLTFCGRLATRVVIGCGGW